MALTQSAWTSATVNGFMVLTCTVAATTSEQYGYTLKTPANLIDGRRPFTVFLQCSADPDAAQNPLVSIAIGYADNFTMGTTAGTSLTGLVGGSTYKQLLDDCGAAVDPVTYSFLIHPDLGVADVVTLAAIAAGFKANVPPAPYYAMNLHSATKLDAHTATWTIVQKV